MADKAPKGIWNSYKKEGDKVVKKNKSCPKCGTGFSLAAHKDRLFCGGCQYTEFIKAPAPEAKPAKK